jgi:ribosomal protein S18 acetylase RimI-like enzyme
MSVYKLLLGEPISEDREIVSRLEGVEVDAIFCFSGFWRENILALERLRFNLVSIRNTYEVSLRCPVGEFETPQGFKVVLARATGWASVRKEDIVSLARTIGATSRYFKDKEIPEEKSVGLYVRWLENSLYNGYADEAILAVHDEEVVGIHTLRVMGDYGLIDLIGVKPEYQQYGLGTALLCRGLQFFRAQGLSAVRVITEGENIAATRFYEKNQFLLSQVELAYHKHLRSLCLEGTE